MTLRKISSILALLLSHPNEFCTLVQFYLFRGQKRDITAKNEHTTSGWDRKTMRRCWELLDRASKNFAAIIKELDGDLVRTVCIYYLALRALDTIEDDKTLSYQVKQSILRSFHEKTVTSGWHFTGSGPNEKDRQLLVEYATVVEEINLLKPEYRKIIVEVCAKMGAGMADYAHKAATTGVISITTIAEYDLYCHYAAGLVGEGLSAFWSASGKEVPRLRDELELSNAMGLFLQKASVMRDFREDCDDDRFFWPKEIWGKQGFDHLTELYQRENEERATWVQSEIIPDALRHACDTLDYLKLLENQSVFVFCAIPAVLAMAEFATYFKNPELFHGQVDVTKGEAVRLIMRTTNLREVALIFRDYARQIHNKAKPHDPGFLQLSVMCSKIEEWHERNYPLLAVPGQNGIAYNPEDERMAIVQSEKQRTRGLEGRINWFAASLPSTKLPWNVLSYFGGLFLLITILVALG